MDATESAAGRSADGAPDPEPLVELVERLYPGGALVAARALDADEEPDGVTTKAAGYGAPVWLRVRDGAGQPHELVVHTAVANEFGHDRRADRAEELLLAYDVFTATPRHVRALDVGAIGPDGRLRSLRDLGEFYLVTDYAPGAVYADDLRRIAQSGTATAADRERVLALARYLAELHRRGGGGAPLEEAVVGYRRAVRDLVGHGEGIFGLIDSYPDHTPGAPPERLRAIESRAAAWRWRLRGLERRLTRTHGDFHPFNVVFQSATEFTMLDASRGGRGEPADDVTCMAINYAFFALDHPASWASALRPLLELFLGEYLNRTRDAELRAVAPPFFAWRALVLASPRFYPQLAPESRARLLACAERVLDDHRLELRRLEELFD
jgi:hypothetical protein